MTSKIMTNSLLIAWFFLTSWGTLSAHSQVSSNYHMPKDVLSNSGGKANSSNYQLVSTIGQTATTIGLSSNTMLYAGFHQALSATLTLVVATNPSPICTGESFDITFQTTPETHSVDDIEFYLKFDPTKLQSNSFTNSGILDDVLVEEIDNTEGYLHFAAGIWDNEAPSGTFELVTINFTLLAATDSTNLQVDLANSIAMFEGQPLSVRSQDETLITQDCMACKVNLQGRSTIPPAHSSWETDLRIYISGKAPYTIKTDGLGHCILPEPAGDYSICVKGLHTLANQIGPPLGLDSDNWLDFGTLLEGDVNDDNQVDLLDRYHLRNSKDKCQGDDGYLTNADLNEDACVDRADYDLFKANFNRPKGDENPAVCELDTSVAPLSLSAMPPTLLPTGSVTLQTTPPPANLTVGTSFNIAVQVNATQKIDAAEAYLNFDPNRLQVNDLTAGDTLDSVLENHFDNEQGEINFIAGTWDNELPKGIFTLVTINFTLLDEGGEQTLVFNTTAPRQTKAIVGGQSIMTVRQPGKVNTVEPASCQLYAVNADKLNNSQFFTIRFAENNDEISELGPWHEGYDIKALAIHPETNMIYAVSGNEVSGDNPKGHFYLVDGKTGELFPIGSTGFEEISDLSFSPDGTLWGWATGVGLITIDLTTGLGTVEIASTFPVEASTLPVKGLISTQAPNPVWFGVSQIDLWRYDWEAQTLEVICSNLLGETEALEMISNDLFLVSSYQAPLGLYALDALTCEHLPVLEGLNSPFFLQNVGGIAMPVAACEQLEGVIGLE